jgi:hypothetical protein
VNDGATTAALLQAVPPSDNLAAKLRSVCPSLWSDQGGSKGHYCCTPDQVDQLATNVSAFGGRGEGRSQGRRGLS